ncbi:MAG: xanthine dehydrogenase family protein molybdopterin-binding subunit, partial [Pseudomonadota bacterium]
MSDKGIGASVPRKEDTRHLHGRGQFVSDLRFHGLRDVAFVRSPVAHGWLRSVDIPEELRENVFLASDFPDVLPLRAVPEVSGFRPSVFPGLATDKVRFVGQPIAMCVGATRAEAEDIAQMVFPEIDELPAASDTLKALEPDAPRIHDDWDENVFIRKSVEAGDIDIARNNASVVVERTYRMNRQAGVPLEGRAILAHWDHRLDELAVYNSSQFPHQIRAGMAQFLQIEERQLHVIAPDVGGGFGVKNILYPEELMVAALARKLRQPVRWIEDRREHFLASIHCREHVHKIKAYADDKGRILGLDAEVYVDAGAYSHWPNSPFMETGMAAKNIPGPYRVENYRCHTLTVCTNKSPIGPYRGVARPAACFTIERTIDEIARAVGREPHEVRMENMVRPAEMPYRSVTNLLYDNGDYAKSVQMAAELIDFDSVRERQKSPEPDGRLIGVGFATYTEQTAHGCGEWVTRGTPVIPGFESATARLMTDGTLMLLVGIQSHGQGLETTLAQVAHHELSLDPDRISVRHGDSTLSPFGMGTFASRSMVMAGGAVAKSCRLLRDKMADIAAHLLQCESDQIEFRDGTAFGPQGEVSFQELGRIAHLRQDGLPLSTEPTLEATTTYQPGIDTGVFCYSTQVALVAVDPDTGHVEILDYGVVEDCGTMVNPKIVDGQIQGGVAQGIGTALYEEIPYDDFGQPLATTFADYLMP